ncbi:hypothetical protein CAB08_11395 [Vibrio cholerae]|nr:hypothetical protein [Vibrio cholerae]MCD1236580.1 hypothetical protein [Vibrio cholerae]
MASPSHYGLSPSYLKLQGLATFVHPNHIVSLCSWGLTHLPPTCYSKLVGYILFFECYKLV